MIDLSSPPMTAVDWLVTYGPISVRVTAQTAAEAYRVAYPHLPFRGSNCDRIKPGFAECGYRQVEE